jgi:hypothetical protein
MPGQFEGILDKLQTKLGKQTIKRASTINRPRPKREVQQIQIFNEFNRRNPKADGGSADDYEPSAFSKKVNELMDDGYDFGEAVREAMRQGYKKGGKVGYPGSSLESVLEDIKKLYLKGKTNREIFKSNPKKFKAKSTVGKAIIAMKKGVAPVKISKTESKKRKGPVETAKQTIKESLEKDYKTLKKKLKRIPTKEELAKYSKRPSSTIRTYLSDDLFPTSRSAKGGASKAAKVGGEASTKMFMERKVDKPTRTTYEGVKGAKFKNAAQEKRYKSFLEKAAKYPKGSPSNPYNKKFFAKEFNMPETDVESIHKVVREKYNIKYSKPKDTSAGRRSKQLAKTSLPGLEQEYTRLKKDTKNIFNPDLAHRQSKIFNVTTSNLGLDNPVINRIIVKPNETKIAGQYANRTKIHNKYLKKDGTYSKPSVEDSKKLRQINLKIRQLVSQTNGRLNGKISNSVDLNKPLKDFGIDLKQSIGGQIVKNIPLQKVRELPLEKQQFLKDNILKIKDFESRLTAQNIADQFPDMLKDQAVRTRLENIINKQKQPRPILKMAKEILQKSKPVVKRVAKALPVVGTAIGIADVANAYEQGVRNPIDLFAAYQISPETALASKQYREDPEYRQKSRQATFARPLDEGTYDVIDENFTSYFNGGIVSLKGVK